VSAHPSTTPSLASSWPDTAHWGPLGLEIGGIPAITLAEEYGTPLLVLDVEHLRRRCAELRRAFPLSYLSAAELVSPQLLRFVNGEGLRLLASSLAELDASLSAGVAPVHLALQGDGAALEAAVEAGIGLLLCSSPDALAPIAAAGRRLGRRQSILLDTALGESPESPELFETVERVLESPHLRLRGLRAAVGTSVLDAESGERAIDALLGFAGRVARRLGGDIELIDLAAVPGTAGGDEALDIGLVAEALQVRLDQAAGRERVPGPRLMVEPGASLLERAGVTLCRLDQAESMSGLAVTGVCDLVALPAGARRRAPGGARRRLVGARRGEAEQWVLLDERRGARQPARPL
jgi:diaminopimelate decarboxylase